MHTKPIGVFDSGIGGLSVLNALKEMLPQEDILYVADQAYTPYGKREKETITATCSSHYQLVSCTRLQTNRSGL